MTEKQWYAYSTPSGPINLIEGMPVHPNERIKIERNGSDIQVVKDGNLVVWSVDARADDYAYSNAENYAHRLKVQLLKEYESTLQAAKASSVPIQDQEKAKRMIMQWLNDQPLGQGMIERDRVHGPFTVEYRIEDACAHDSCPVDGMCEHCKEPVKIAILYDYTPEKEESQETLLNELITDIFEAGKEAILEKFTITRK